MASSPPQPVPGRSRTDPGIIPFPKEAVLIGESLLLREAESYFSAHVRETRLRTLAVDAAEVNGLPPGFPIAGPWCLICDLVTSHKSLRIARKILMNTSNVPFIAIVNDPAEMNEADLRVILELGITHVLPLPASWGEAWVEVKKVFARRLNPLLSVHSTKMWLVGVLQSVASEERDCCIRISSRNHGKAASAARDHGTSLRISPVGLLGEVYFRGGQPIYAWSTRLQGDEAIIDLLQTSNVQISVLDSSWMPPTRNVRSPLQGVLLEFMRRKDLGQLEPPSTSIILTGEGAEGDPGAEGTGVRRRVTASVSGLSSAGRRAARLWPVWGALAVALLVVILVVALKSPGPPASMPVESPTARPEAKAPLSPNSTGGTGGAGLGNAPGVSPEKGATPLAPKPPARELVLTLGERVPLELVLIPAGRFTMGSREDEWGRDPSEGPPHPGVLSAAFYMARFETTQEQYEAVMGQNPSQFKGPRRPVETVSSFDAQEFCERATKRAGREVRLPTEVEWEYACRAGSQSPFSPGSTLRPTDANCDGRPGYAGGPPGTYRGMTLDVGSFPPNAFGLYDMHGNVGEWCLDFFDPKAYDVPVHGPMPFSPSRPERVWRGGAYNDPPRRCRSANREHFNPGGKDSVRGFRVVVPVEAPVAGPEEHEGRSR